MLPHLPHPPWSKPSTYGLSDGRMTRPTPSLHAEWQVVVCLDNGVVVISCGSEWDARAKVRRIRAYKQATARIEQRFVTDWRAVSAPVPAKVDPGVGLRRRRD